MKKILLLAAVSATGLLASCGGGNGGTPGNVTMTSIGFASEHTLKAPITDQNGRVYSAGTSVICDNWATDISVPVTWTGGLSKLVVQLKGYTTGDFKNLSVYPYSAVDSSGTGSVEYTIAPGLAPLSLKPQTIVPTPIVTTTVKGYTYVRAQGYDAFGNLSNIVTSDYAIPVVDCQ